MSHGPWVAACDAVAVPATAPAASATAGPSVLQRAFIVELLCPGGMRSASRPFLGAAPVTGLQGHRRAVGGAVPAGGQAQSGLDTGDRPVRTGVPLLVGAARAVPDDRPGTGRGAGALGVEALAAVHLELLRGVEGPLLVGAAVAVPQ